MADLNVNAVAELDFAHPGFARALSEELRKRRIGDPRAVMQSYHDGVITREDAQRQLGMIYGEQAKYTNFPDDQGNAFEKFGAGVVGNVLRMTEGVTQMVAGSDAGKLPGIAGEMSDRVRELREQYDGVISPYAYGALTSDFVMGLGVSKALKALGYTSKLKMTLANAALGYATEGGDRVSLNRLLSAVGWGVGGWFEARSLQKEAAREAAEAVTRKAATEAATAAAPAPDMIPLRGQEGAQAGLPFDAPEAKPLVQGAVGAQAGLPFGDETIKATAQGVVVPPPPVGRYALSALSEAPNLEQITARTVTSLLAKQQVDIAPSVVGAFQRHSIITSALAAGRDIGEAGEAALVQSGGEILAANHMLTGTAKVTPNLIGGAIDDAQYVLAGAVDRAEHPDVRDAMYALELAHSAAAQMAERGVANESVHAALRESTRRLYSTLVDRVPADMPALWREPRAVADAVHAFDYDQMVTAAAEIVPRLSNAARLRIRPEVRGAITALEDAMRQRDPELMRAALLQLDRITPPVGRLPAEAMRVFELEGDMRVASAIAKLIDYATTSIKPGKEAAVVAGLTARAPANLGLAQAALQEAQVGQVLLWRWMNTGTDTAAADLVLWLHRAEGTLGNANDITRNATLVRAARARTEGTVIDVARRFNQLFLRPTPQALNPTLPAVMQRMHPPEKLAFYTDWKVSLWLENTVKWAQTMRADGVDKRRIVREVEAVIKLAESNPDVAKRYASLFTQLRAALKVM